MNLSFLTSFFQKKQKELTVPDTILIKRLKDLSLQSNLLVFKDVDIYHHSSSYRVGLMVLDPLRGLYLFETKEWTYDELKNADIKKAQNQSNSNNTLAFDNTQNIIRQKFNELTHSDGVPIFNYLLMENLNADEYEHLNDSFKELLPEEKIIFSDSLESDIFKKLQDASFENTDLPSVDTIMGTLLIQYSILDDENKEHLCTLEQQEFIDSEITCKSNLKGPAKSGKSTLILLKSIKELLKRNVTHIIILKSTTLACDILKKKLLDIIEHAIIEIDLNAIEIITPLELINKHRLKLHKKMIEHIEIEDKLMKKGFKGADLVICDDAHLLPTEFIAYLKYIQKKEKLLLVNADIKGAHVLSQSFMLSDRTINYYKTTPHAKAIRLIEKLLKGDAKNIVVVSNFTSSEKLKEDLSSFITQIPEKLDSSIVIINQNFTNLMLCNYSDINSIQANHVILMDLCFVSENLLEYAFNLANKSVDVLYEEDCQEITNLRNKYDQSSKE